MSLTVICTPCREANQGSRCIQPPPHEPYFSRYVAGSRPAESDRLCTPYFNARLGTRKHLPLGGARPAPAGREGVMAAQPLPPRHARGREGTPPRTAFGSPTLSLQGRVAKCDCRSASRGDGSQPEHIQHRGVALLLDLRRVDERAPAGGIEAGRDGDILLAVDLECHWRGVEAGADIELPEFLKRRVVIGRDGSVGQSREHQGARWRPPAADVWVPPGNGFL